MDVNLDTQRLLIRPLAASDLDLRIEMLTDPAVTRHLRRLFTAEQIARDMPNALRRGASGALGTWCITERRSGERLGTTILLPLPVDESQRNYGLLLEGALPDAEIEVGYLLKPAAWGKGYATEACRRLLRFAFEEAALDQVVAVTDRANLASQKVLAKSGLKAEGTRRAFASEVLGYRITREQWLERKAATETA